MINFCFIAFINLKSKHSKGESCRYFSRLLWDVETRKYKPLAERRFKQPEYICENDIYFQLIEVKGWEKKVQDLPYIIVSLTIYEKLNQKHITAKNFLITNKTPADKRKI